MTYFSSHMHFKPTALARALERRETFAEYWESTIQVTNLHNRLADEKMVDKRRLPEVWRVKEATSSYKSCTLRTFELLM